MKYCAVIGCIIMCFGAAAIASDSTTGVISTVAGNGTRGLSGDGGPATSAQLSVIAGIAVDSAGNLYIADQVAKNIRKVSPDGVINTAVGGRQAWIPSTLRWTQRTTSTSPTMTIAALSKSRLQVQSVR